MAAPPAAADRALPARAALPAELDHGCSNEHLVSDVAQTSTTTWNPEAVNPEQAEVPQPKFVSDLRRMERMKDSDKLELTREGTLLSRASSAVRSATSNLQMQRANTLPSNDKRLRYAAHMPMAFDIDARRPCCCGLWKSQQFVGLVLGAALFLVFTVEQPLQTLPNANRMFGITSLCACFWMFEVVPLFITSLLPMVLVPLMGIDSSEHIASAYWSWISMLVLATYLLDVALEHANLPRRISLALLCKVGVVRPSLLLACFMGLSWVLSMFVNRIAVTLVVTPFATALMNTAEDEVRIAAEEAADQAQEAGHMEEAQAREAEGHAHADTVQTFADALLIGIAFSASIGGIATLTGAIPNYFLAGQKILDGRVSWITWAMYALPISFAILALAYSWLYLRYVHRLRFQGISQPVLQREYEDLLHEFGPMSRDDWLIALLQVLQFALLIARPFTTTRWVTSPYGDPLVDDATLALVPALMLFIIPSQLRQGEALLTWPVVRENFDFGLLLLVGGSCAINEGFLTSGLSVALGDMMESLLHPNVGLLSLNLAVVAAVTLCSQVFSSISTAATVLPVLSAASVQAMFNPLCVMLPATLATSFTFLLPTASPPNVIILVKSQELSRPLRFRDFFMNGLPLTIAAVVVGAAISLIMSEVVFDGSRTGLPRWACENSGRCVWVEVPGVVRGAAVTAQACLQNMASDPTICALWNGTEVSTPPQGGP